MKQVIILIIIGIFITGCNETALNLKVSESNIRVLKEPIKLSEIHKLFGASLQGHGSYAWYLKDKDKKKDFVFLRHSKSYKR